MAVLGVLAACSNPIGGERLDLPRGGLTIASGGSQGVYYAYANEYARVLRQEIPGLEVRVVPTAGSVDNLERLAEGEAQLGFATADTAYDAIDPKATGSPSQNLRAIGRIYDEYIHLVVPKTSPVRSVEDLRGLRVSTGSVGSSTDLTAGRVLKSAELDADSALRRSRLGINDSVAALREHQIDAFFWSGGLPTPAIQKLAETVAIRLVPLDEKVNPLREKWGAFYRRAVVPESTYQGVDPAATIGLPNYLVVSGDLDDQLVYELTRALFSRRGEIAAEVPSGRLLDARSAISTMPIPLHPGAERYYRDVKP